MHALYSITAYMRMHVLYCEDKSFNLLNPIPTYSYIHKWDIVYALRLREQEEGMVGMNGNLFFVPFNNLNGVLTHLHHPILSVNS